MKWFRMHHGASSHKKWLLIARKSGQPVPVVGMVAWALMEQASKSIPRGDTRNFKADEYAAFLDVEEECVEAIIKAFKDKEWIKDGILVSWEDNNPKSDYSTERVRKHRKRKKAVTETGETVTETKRNKSNGLDKIREDNKKKIYKRKVALPEDFPNEEAKKKALAYWKQKNVDVELEAEILKFRGHHEKNGTLALSWDGAWQTWYVNAVRWGAEPKSDLGREIEAL